LDGCIIPGLPSEYEATYIYLNDDNQKDFFVIGHLDNGERESPFWVFLNKGKSYELIFETYDCTLIILNTKSNGYRNIIVAGGPGSRSVTYTLYIFDGKKYIKSEECGWYEPNDEKICSEGCYKGDIMKIIKRWSIECLGIYFAGEKPPESNVPPEAPLCYKFNMQENGVAGQLDKLKAKYGNTLYDEKIVENEDGKSSLTVKRKDETSKVIEYFYSESPDVCNKYQEKRLKSEQSNNDIKKEEIYFACENPPKSNDSGDALLFEKVQVSSLEEQLGKLMIAYSDLHDEKIIKNDDGSSSLTAKRKNEKCTVVEHFYTNSLNECKKYQEKRLANVQGSTSNDNIASQNSSKKEYIYYASEKPPDDNIPPESPLCYKFQANLEEQLAKLKAKYGDTLYDEKIVKEDNHFHCILTAKKKDETAKEIKYFYSNDYAICHKYQQERLINEESIDIVSVHEELTQIGNIRLGLSENEVRKAIPCKQKKVSDPSDILREFLTYRDCGIFLELSNSRDSFTNSFKVSFITVKSPSTLQTKRGIRIGSSKQDVIKAYRLFYNPYAYVSDYGEKIADTFFASYNGEGDDTRGIMFYFQKGIVNRIEVGGNDLMYSGEGVGE